MFTRQRRTASRPPRQRRKNEWLCVGRLSEAVHPPIYVLPGHAETRWKLVQRRHGVDKGQQHSYGVRTGCERRRVAGRAHCGASASAQFDQIADEVHDWTVQLCGGLAARRARPLGPSLY